MKLLQRRVVIDTTVVVAAALDRKHPKHISYARDIVKRWHDGNFRAVVSDALLDEYRRKLREVDGVSPEVRDQILDLAVDEARTEHHILAPAPYPKTSADSDDDHLFALLSAAEPDYLCSHDKEGVLRVVLRGDTQVVSPMQLQGMLALYDLEVGTLEQSNFDFKSKLS